MKKTKQKKEQNKLLFTIGAVVTIIVIIAGSTYAYWSWQTSDAQKTNVSVTVKGATMTITGNNLTSATLRPTEDCDGEAALVGNAATITIVNETGTEMRATPRLDVKLTPKQGTLSSSALSHLHWALVDTSGSATCASPDYQGTFDKVIKPTVSRDSNNNVVISYGSSNSALNPSAMSASTNTTIDITKNIANFSSTMNATTQLNNTLTFIADEATINTQGVTTPKTTTKSYRVYVWLDKDYTHTNTGNTVSDPMQDLSITVKWSANSTLVQE